MRVLMVARTHRWLGPPRLLHALAAAGATTAALGHGDGLLHILRSLHRHFKWTDAARMDWADLEAAVAAFRPDRLLAADDPTVGWLQGGAARTDLSPALAALVIACRGRGPHTLSLAADKLATTRLAAQLGIDVPDTAELTADGDAGVFAHRHGWPIVIKACHGFAGLDVFPCGDLRELRQALATCPRDRGRMIQPFQAGTTWMSLLAADRGRLLGQFSLVKERQYPPLTGPSSVVRSAFDADLLAATARIVAELGFSGFGSIDFLVTAAGRKLLLEFNPRLVPASHLGAELGVDLVRAWVTGRAVDPHALVPDQRIALFPQELLREPDGSGLAGCRHDVPWDEPELVAALSALLPPAARKLVHPPLAATP